MPRPNRTMKFWKFLFPGPRSEAPARAQSKWAIPLEDRSEERRRFISQLRRTVGTEARSGKLSAEFERVWQRMEALPREFFVPAPERARAYQDESLAIGFGQTVPQPSLLARMLVALAPRSSDRVLDIGAGSGYQTALLAGLCGRVYGVERAPELAEHARHALAFLRIGNGEIIGAEGARGWPPGAPYDCILSAHPVHRLPEHLIDQLKIGGRLIAAAGPILGPRHLILVEKKAAGRTIETMLT